MNQGYASVVAFGMIRILEDDEEKRRALDAPWLEV